MATVKEKVAGIKEMERRVEAGVAELHQGMREKVKGINEETDEMRRGVAEIHRGTIEIEARFDSYAKEEFWG